MGHDNANLLSTVVSYISFNTACINGILQCFDESPRSGSMYRR